MKLFLSSDYSVVRNDFSFPMQGLRDMLEISRKSGSLSNPLVGPKKVSRGCQTDDPPEESVFPSAASNPGDLSSTAILEVTSYLLVTKLPINTFSA